MDIKKMFALPALAILMIFAIPTYALPVGDPRTPDENALAKINVPIRQGVHELSLHTFMGASKIDYPDMFRSTLFSPGFGAAITYNYFFLDNWSLLVGGGLQLYNNRGTIVNDNFSGDMITDDFADSTNSATNAGQVRLFYDFQDYSETQWSLMVMIPIMFQYQSNEVRNKAFYYALGAKIGIPFSGAYEGTAKSAKVCGYYPGLWGDVPEGYNFNRCSNPNDPEAGYYEGFENNGFGDFGEKRSYMKLKLSTAFFAAAEAGVKWRIYNKLAIYTGFWLDWALNDVAIRSVNDQPFKWIPKDGISDGKTPNSDIDFMSRTEGKAIPVSMGFTVRFALGGGTQYYMPDTTKWIREIYYKDSLLAACRAKLAADSARAADSIAMLNHMAEALMDSLIACRGRCHADAMDKDALRRQLDSLEALRLAGIERDRLAALERARQDSLARAEQLERERAARLADYRKKLAAVVNGLDDYKVTQTVPPDKAREKLDIAYELMRDYPDLKVRFTGHTCDKGTHEANMRFGIQRAESAKNYLVNKGINPSRIETATKAELEPVLPNVTEEHRRKNRRVQIEILEGADKIEQEAK